MVRWIGLTLGYLAVSVVMTWPLMNYTHLATASYPGDARLIMWTLAWDNHATIGGLPLFDSNIYYPAANSLSHNDHLFGLSLFTLPIHVATRNPALAYNLVWLLSYLLSGVAMHALLRRYVRSDLAAFAGSLVFTFSFYKMLHGHGHLQQVWAWLIPVSVLCLERWRERPTMTRALIWAMTVVLQALTSWYLAVMVGVVQAVVAAVVAAVLIRDGGARRLWQLAFAAALGAAVIWPFARQYQALAVTDVREAAMYSADVAGYLVPPENTWIGKAWLARGGTGPRWIWGERTLYLGWVAMVLAAVGVYDVVARRQRRVGIVYGALLIAGFALSLGPAVPPDTSWTAFGLLSSLPGVGSFRAPARFALVLLFALSVFAGCGARRIAGGMAGRIILIALLPLMLSEYFVLQFPNGKPQPFPVPAIYGAPAVAGARGLVSLPDYTTRPPWFLEPDYLFYSTAHWRPIANGYGRSSPPTHVALLTEVNNFPAPTAAAAMRAAGIDVVVLHTARYGGDTTELVRTATASPDFQLLTQIGPDYLFKVVPAP